jgi:hypothetical protein
MELRFALLNRLRRVPLRCWHLGDSAHDSHNAAKAEMCGCHSFMLVL